MSSDEEKSKKRFSNEVCCRNVGTCCPCVRALIFWGKIERNRNRKRGIEKKTKMKRKVKTRTRFERRTERKIREKYRENKCLGEKC